MLLGAIYTALDRLEENGLVTSSYGDPTPERGGRAKRFFKVTGKGLKAVKGRNAPSPRSGPAFRNSKEGHLNEPPRLAQLLLERLAPANEALLGDVAEAFREHQSAVWYWCQTVWATISGVVAEVRHDPLLGARAVLTGGGLQVILVWAFWKIWFRTLSQPAFDFAQSTWGQSVLNEPYRLITATFWVGPGIFSGGC